MPQRATRSPFNTARHDHRRCVRAAIERAEALCRERGARLTAQRKEVLALVWASHRPIGAYAVLEAMRKAGHKAAPPTVYRALEFLLEQGLIHRIESLNAYAGCNHPGTEHSGQFLVCSGCGDVAELDDPGINRSIDRCAARAGFRTEHPTVEIRGLCPRCDHGDRDG